MADIGVRLVVLGLAEFRRGISSAQGDVRSLEGEIRGVSNSAANVGTSITRIGTTIAGFGRDLSLFVTLPIVAAGTALETMGIKFEDGFAGITKTVDGLAVGFDEIKQQAAETLGITVTNMEEARAAAEKLGMEFGDLTTVGQAVKKQFEDLAETVPLPFDDLLHLGELVGALGVNKDQIAEVTKTIAQLGITTDISAEDAGVGLIKWGNIMHGTALNVEDFVHRAGSALVDLGNKSVSTEGEILDLTLRIAAAGQRAQLTEPEILAWGTTLADLGINAELGGSAFSRVLNSMSISVATMSGDIDFFAKITGKSTEQFARDFKENAGAAMLDFVQKFQLAIATGQVTEDMLKGTALAGIRAIDVFGRLGGASDLYNKNLAIANEGWSQNIALEDEAAKKTNTMASQLIILKNTFAVLGDTINNLVKDDFKAFIDMIKNLIAQFVAMPAEQQKMILLMVGIAAAIGPVLIIIGSLIAAIGVIITALTAVSIPLLLIGGMVLALGAAFASTIPQLLSGGEAATTVKKIFDDLSFIIDEMADGLQFDLGTHIKAVADLFSGILLKALKDFSTWLSDNRENIIHFTDAVILLITDGMTALGNIINTVVLPVLESVGIVIGGVILSLGDLYFAFQDGLRSIQPFLDVMNRIATTNLAYDFGILSNLVSTLAEDFGILVTAVKSLDLGKMFGDSDILSTFAGLVAHMQEFAGGLIQSAALGIKEFARGFVEQLAPKIQESGPQIVAIFESIKTLISAINPLFEAMGKLLTALFGNTDMKELGKAFGDIAATNLSNFLAGLSLFIDMLTSAVIILTSVIGLVTQLVTFVSSIPTKFEAVKNSVVGFFTGIKDSITKTVEDITNTFEQIIGIPDKIAASATSKASDVSTAFTDMFLSVKDSIMEVVSSIGEDIAGKINNAKEAIGSTFSTLFDSAKETVQTAIESVKTAIDKKIAEIKEGIHQFFLDLLGQDILDRLATVPGKLEEMFSVISGKTSSKLLEVKTSVTTSFTDLIAQITAKLNEFLLSIELPLSQAVLSFVGKFLEIRDGVFAAVEELILTVTTRLTALWDQVTIIFDSIKNDVANKITEFRDRAILLYNEFSTAVQQIFAAIGLWFEQKYTEIKTVILAKINEFREAAIGLYTQFMSQLHAVVDPIVDWFTGLFDRIKKSVTDRVQQLKDGVNKILTDLKNLANNIMDAMADAIINTVRDLVNGVLDWFDNLYEEVVGHSIVPDMVAAVIKSFNSLIEPINSVFNKIKTALDLFSAKLTSVVSKVKSSVDTMISDLRRLLASITSSPTLTIQHPFEAFEDYLKNADFSFNMNMGNIDGATSALNGATSHSTSISTNDNSKKISIGNITGVPMRNEIDLADLLTQRLEAARI